MRNAIVTEKPRRRQGELETIQATDWSADETRRWEKTEDAKALVIENIVTCFLSPIRVSFRVQSVARHDSPLPRCLCGVYSRLPMLDYSVLPRPEYPRPDRQRSFVEGHDWLNLNGPWQFRFDSQNDGKEGRWFDPATGGWEEQIIVPFCWESLAAWGQGDAAGNDNYYATRVFREPLTDHAPEPPFRLCATRSAGTGASCAFPATALGRASGSSSPWARRISSRMAGATARRSATTKAATRLLNST